MHIRRIVGVFSLLVLSCCLLQDIFAKEITSGSEIARLSSPELKPPSPGKVFERIDQIGTPRGEGLRANIVIVNDFPSRGIWSETHARAPEVRMLLSGDSNPNRIQAVLYKTRSERRSGLTRTLLIQNTDNAEEEAESSCTMTSCEEDETTHSDPQQDTPETSSIPDALRSGPLTLTIIVPFGFQIDARQFNLADGYTVTDGRFNITLQRLRDDPLMRNLGELAIAYWADMSALERLYWDEMQKLWQLQNEARKAENKRDAFERSMIESENSTVESDRINARNSGQLRSDLSNEVWRTIEAVTAQSKELKRIRHKQTYRQLEWFELQEVLTHLAMGPTSPLAREGMDIPPTLETRLDQELGGGSIGCTLM